MIQVNRLSLTNFRSFESADLKLYELPAMTLIPGVNGLGKSSLLYAISWALFGGWLPKGSPRLMAGDVVNWDQDEAVVQLYLVANEHEIHITRTRGSSQSLVVEVDGTSIGSTTTDKQNKLLALLNIDPKSDYIDDFCSSVFFSANSIRAFAGPGMTSEQKMLMLSRYLNVGVMDRCKQLAADERGKLESTISELTGRRNALTGQMSSLPPMDEEKRIQGQKELDEAQAELDKMEEMRVSFEKLEVLKSQAMSVASNLESQQGQISRTINIYQDEMGQLKNEMDEISYSIKPKLESLQRLIVEVPDGADLRQTQTELQEARLEIRSFIVSWEQSIESLRNQIENTLICPSCGDHLMYKEGKLHPVVIEALEADVKAGSERLAEATEVDSDLHKEVTKVIMRLKELDDLRTKNRKVETEVRALEAKVSRLPDIVALLEKRSFEIGALQENSENLEIEAKEKLLDIKTKAEQIEFPGDPDQFKNSLYDQRKNVRKLIGYMESVRNIIRQRTKLGEQLKEVTDNLETVEKEYEIYTFWEKGFPTIRRWMIDQQLPILEGQINDFLYRVGVDFMVELRTMKEKASGGEAFANFNILVTDSSGRARPIETLSGGEERRVAIAIGLGLRAVGLSQGYMDFDLMMVDEIIDSLDERGVEELFNILNSIPGKKLVISHDSSLKSQFDSVISIVNNHGVSSIQ